MFATTGFHVDEINPRVLWGHIFVSFSILNQTVTYQIVHEEIITVINCFTGSPKHLLLLKVSRIILEIHLMLRLGKNFVNQILLVSYHNFPQRGHL